MSIENYSNSSNYSNYSYTNMGKPITSPCLIPVRHKSTPNCINSPFMVNGEVYRLTCLSFGTPHGAVFFENIETVDINNIGKTLENHPLFPEGASIVFIQVLNKKQIKARLWQRGKGETPYTYEAVCVAMTSARMLQKIYSDDANVFMDDNKFHVNWKSLTNDVYVAGPINT